MIRRLPFCLTALMVLGGLSGMAQASIHIVFDYSYDNSHFFTNNADARNALQAAANVFDNALQDNLAAIQPSDGNTWNAQFFDPRDPNASLSITDSTISANEILIYAGAADLGGSTLGEGGPGGWHASGFGNWGNTVKARGQTGALASQPTDFGPWGGAVTFNNSSSYDWNFNVATGPTAGQIDFYSIALHELGHVLGIGTAASWMAQVSNDKFTGADSEAAYGGAIPLDTSPTDPDAHWAAGTLSSVDGVLQQTVMQPSINYGQRRYFTKLDWAGLQDIGWEVAVPSPASVLLLLAGLPLLLLRRRGRVG